MNFTKRGETIFLVMIGLLFSSVALQENLIVVSAFLIALIALLADFALLFIITHSPARWFRIGWVSPEKDRIFSQQLIVGEVVNEEFVFRKKARVEITISTNNPAVTFSPDSLGEGDFEKHVRVEIRSAISGDYSSETLQIGVISTMKLFRSKCALPFSINLAIVPKVLDIAVSSLKILVGGGVAGMGEYPVERPGKGSEFYETRSYQSGDDYRSINWKATARRGEIIVNEKMKELGTSAYVILEAYASSYFDQDRLASTFLAVVNELSILGMRFGIFVHDGLGNITVFERTDSPTRILPIAMNSALSFAGIEEGEVKEFLKGSEELSPVAAQVVIRTAETMAKRGQSRELVSEIGKIAMAQRKSGLERGGYQELINLFKESAEGHPTLFYVSGLYGASEGYVIELASMIRRAYGARFILLNPIAPWIVAPSEQEGLKEYKSYLKKLGALRYSNIQYYVGEPQKIVSGLFS